MSRTRLGCIVLAAWIAAPAALDACGDKFLLVGRGLSFGRAYASVYPGSIIVFSGPRTNEAYGKLAQHIRRAGHRVHLVADQSALNGLLGLGQTDIVIADVDMKQALDAQVITAPLRPSLLYIVGDKDKQRAAAAQQQTPGALKSGAKANTFLAQIEATMKARAQAGVRVKRG